MGLRPYQEEAVTAVLDKFEVHQRTAAVLATGAGKTVIFAELIRRWRERHPGQPVLVLAHRSELLQQAAEKIRFWAPDLRVGLVQAGVNQVWADVIVASQQTLARSARLGKIPPVSLIVVDECHRTMGPSYQKVLEELGAMRSDGPRVLGVTATFTREDSRRLTEFYQSVAYSIDILELIDPALGKVDRPYLVPPKFRRVLVEGLDLTAVRSSRLEGGKDLAAGDLDVAMEKAGAPGVVAAAYRIHASDRPGIVFTPTVHSAELVRDALRGEGISSEMVSGTTPKHLRSQILHRFKAGTLQTIVNCAVLTEGFDAPITSCILLARPTMSKILFRQMVGRGTRMAPGKTDCLVLDMAGATGRNDLRTLNDMVDVPVRVREDELLTDAVQREKKEAAERAVIEGDAMVSGSLAVTEYDPWDAERRSKLSKRELAVEDGELEEEDEPPALTDKKPPPESKRRYQHVEFRSGWFLRSHRSGVWFIPLEPNKQQRGFIAVVPADGGYAVAVNLPGVTWHDHVVMHKTADEAAQLALDLALKLLTTADQRGRIDPEARWRRRPATTAQLKFLNKLGLPGDEPDYSGQAADLITVAKDSRSVDYFASAVARRLTTVLA